MVGGSQLLPHKNDRTVVVPTLHVINVLERLLRWKMDVRDIKNEYIVQARATRQYSWTPMPLKADGPVIPAAVDKQV